MSKLLSLVKIQLISSLGINKILYGRNGKRNATVGAILAVGFIALLCYCGYTYSKMIYDTITLYGLNFDLMTVMTALVFFVTFFLSFYSVGNSLFGFKDYDVLASMPLKKSQVVISKFVSIYLSDVFFSIALLVPSFVFYSETTVVTASAIIGLVLSIVFSPLLSLAVSTLVGTLVFYVSSRFKRKNVVQTALYLLLLAGIVSVYFVFGDKVWGIVVNAYFVSPFYDGMIAGDVLSAVLYCAVCFGSALLITVVVTATYEYLNTAFKTTRSGKKHKKAKIVVKGLNRTLFRHELTKLFAIPVYAVNTLMSAIMTILSTAVICSLYFNTDAKEFITMLVSFVLPPILAFVGLMSPSTSCSVSVDGETFWIMRTAPVSTKRTFCVKLLVNFIVNGLIATACVLVVGIATKTSALDAVLYCVTALAISVYGGNFGLLCNLRFPYLRWENVKQPVKQSPAVLLCVLNAFVCATLFGVGTYFGLKDGFPAIWYLVPVASFTLVLAAATTVILFAKGEKILEKQDC